MNDAVVQFAIRVLQTNHISTHIVCVGTWDDAIPFDLRLRESLNCSREETETFFETLKEMNAHTVYHITDSFGCLYTAIPLPEAKDKALLIGPTMENEEWEKLAKTIGKQRNLPGELQQQLYRYYLRLPKLSLIGGYHAVVLELGKYLFGDQMNVRYIQLEPDQLCPTDEYILPLSSIGKPALSMQMMEERYELENSMLEAVHHGNNTLALQALERFNGISVPLLPESDEATAVQHQLVGLNALLRKEVERAEVHPLYLNDLSDDLMMGIKRVKTEASEYRYGIYMLNSYCNLVRRFSMSGYSTIVRNVIRYTHSHIQEDLGLRTLADRFSVNRSYLSSLFKKETGMPFTEFVNRMRIEYAAGLITKQQMSIAEAASMAGFSEVPYFTRQFKRIKNQTPAQFVKAYRKHIHGLSDSENG